MIAVTDTSPLCYLVLIGEVDLLPALYAQVFVPSAVAAELSDQGAPEAVRRWWSAPPGWVRIIAPDTEVSAPGLDRLHRGEQAAILLSIQAAADVLLLDDKAARSAAKGLGLPVMGLIGVLSVAAARNLVDMAAAVDRLKGTNFRVSPALLRDLLDRHGPSES